MNFIGHGYICLYENIAIIFVYVKIMQHFIIVIVKTLLQFIFVRVKYCYNYICLCENIATM